MTVTSTVNKTFEHRGRRVQTEPFIDAQEAIGELEVRERPQAKHRDQERRRVPMTEHHLRQRTGESREHGRRDRRRDEQEHERSAHERVAALLIGVGEVVAQE